MHILCFGDSNTYGFDPRSYCGGRYPAEHRWVDILMHRTGWKIENAGENGREIPRRAYDLQALATILSGSEAPDGLVVMLGTNDLLQGADAAETAARVEKFLTYLPYPRERILLIAPPPVKPGTWVTEERILDASSQLAGQYQRLAQKMNISFADAGCWNVALTFDGVHFSEAGHHSFAEGLAVRLREWVSL